MTTPYRLPFGLALLLTFDLPTPCWPQAPAQIRKIDIQPLLAEIGSAVAKQGGDVEHRGYHFVFAFCTSQFGADPGQGEAMRQAASEVTRSYLVPGDSVSVVAWEMNVWDWQGPFTISGRSGEEKVAELAPHLPQTHAAGSIPGHDLEQALVDVQAHVQANAKSLAPGTVDIFLTPTEDSIDSQSRKEIGQNAPTYLSAIKDLIRRKAVQVHFDEEKTGGQGNWVPRQMDAVVILPQSLQGTMLTGGTRNQLLTPPVPPHRSWLPYALGAAILALLVAVLFKFINRPGPTDKPRAGKRPRIVRIADRQLSLEGLADGHTWRLVGPKFQGSGQDISIGKDREMVPPVLLGEMALRNNLIVLTVFGESSIFLQADVQSREITLSRGANRLEMAGEYKKSPGLPSQSFRTEIDVVVE